MSEPIKVGDLVMVVRGAPCCGCDEAVGLIFRAEWAGWIEPECQYCGQNAGSTFGADLDAIGDGAFDMRMLKRIPPLEELEDEKNKEEMTA